jgi:hypothetical protein
VGYESGYDPEDGGSRLLRNVYTYVPNYGVILKKTLILILVLICCILTKHLQKGMSCNHIRCDPNKQYLYNYENIRFCLLQIRFCVSKYTENKNKMPIVVF